MGVAVRGLILLRCRRAVLAVACALACVPTVGAQSRTGVLEGQVADTSGGVIAGAQVAVRDPGTNQSRVTVTDQNGAFRFTDLPVIFLTAKAMPGDRESAIAAGASDYITKPVDLDELLELMASWVSGTATA